MLLDDMNYWIEHKSYPEDEIAYRFHHKLVWIHLFSNGNGRHARMMTDLVLEKMFRREVFTWGSRNLTNANETRRKYIDALRKADQQDYQSLASFVRT